MIPKIIWQTYEQDYNDLPAYIKENIESWKIHNPDFDHVYMSAVDRERFILNKYPKCYEVYSKMPLNVMKADFWRYLVLHQYGGIYADIDTVCKDSVTKWIKDCNLIIFERKYMDLDDIKFGNYLIASCKNNKILRLLILNIAQLMADPKYVDDFVFTLTGPDIFTKTIKQFINLNFKISNDRENTFNKLEEVVKNKIYYYGPESHKLINEKYVEHLVASKNWKDKEGYASWPNEMIKFLNK